MMALGQKFTETRLKLTSGLHDKSPYTTTKKNISSSFKFKNV